MVMNVPETYCGLSSKTWGYLALATVAGLVSGLMFLSSMNAQTAHASRLFSSVQVGMSQQAFIEAASPIFDHLEPRPEPVSFTASVQWSCSHRPCDIIKARFKEGALHSVVLVSADQVFSKDDATTYLERIANSRNIQTIDMFFFVSLFSLPAILVLFFRSLIVYSPNRRELFCASGIFLTLTLACLCIARPPMVLDELLAPERIVTVVLDASQIETEM
jgi:hypothetical protein